jgi:molybdenum cofactor biosynthesis enzyme MoaA
MKVQTLSIIVGDTSCNAHCPFCVSRMTPKCGVDDKKSFNLRNLKKACQFAKDSGVSTILLTGKGEPMLEKNYDEMMSVLSVINEYSFPFVEVQTNGTKLLEMDGKILNKMWEMGVTTFSISCVHYETKRNREIYNFKYPNLDQLVAYLHKMGFSVRLSCILLKGYVDTVEKLVSFIQKCKEWKVEQFTARPVINAIDKKEILGLNEEDEKKKIYTWTKKHLLPPSVHKAMLKEVMSGDYLNPKKRVETYVLLKLMHGAVVCDYDGQNVCMSTCLTHNSNPEEIRQLIYFPDGHIRYDWKKIGAILL